MSQGYLRRFPRFADLSDADVALLERVFVVTTFPSGQVLFREGDVAKASNAAMYLILEGDVQVVAQAPEGGWGVTRVLRPGQIVGLLALLADVRRSATCTTSGRVVAAKMDRMTLEELFRRDAGVHARFQMAVARQLAADARELGQLMAQAMRSGDATAARERFGAGGGGVAPR